MSIVPNEKESYGYRMARGNLAEEVLKKMYKYYQPRTCNETDLIFYEHVHKLFIADLILLRTAYTELETNHNTSRKYLSDCITAIDAKNTAHTDLKYIDLVEMFITVMSAERATEQ